MKNKKKFLSRLLGTCIIASILLAGTMGALASNAQRMAVQDFEDFSVDGIWVWEDGHQGEFTLDSSVKHDGNKSLKLVLEDDFLKTWITFSFPVAEDRKNWTGADRIEFYIKNTSDVETYLALTLKEANGEPWQFSPGKEVTAVVDGTNHTATIFDSKTIAIPAQFSGVITVPFSSMQVDLAFEGESANGVLDLAEMTNMQFGFQTIGIMENPIYFDAFTVIGESLAGLPSDSDSGNDSDTPVDSENPTTSDAGTIPYLLLLAGAPVIALIKKKK